ncbi:MAG: hypothetical protein GX121_10895 [Ignavibacteria bacterium]|jgi:hypothetical protein|nr:hypothetical protein [Ignavibacteria bacterium]
MEENIENNPFEEQFDSKDVVNRYEKEKPTGKKHSTIGLENLDIDKLIECSDEEYKKRNFKIEYADDFQENEANEEANFLKQNFKDFLTLPRISGTHSVKADSNIISGDKIKADSGFIEIPDIVANELDANGESSTILVNRNSKNEITSIEILCKCGERTVIDFDYDPD